MKWQIAQINVGTILYPIDDPRMAGFTGRLDEINALAEKSPGFVWRLQSDSGNATDIQISDNPHFIINMSVWQSTEHLFDYVYKTVHREVMVQRREWFERPTKTYQALWWVEEGHLPTAQEGMERVEHLEAHGPTPHGFTFKTVFPPPAIKDGPQDMNPEPYCVGWE